MTRGALPARPPAWHAATPKPDGGSPYRRMTPVAEAKVTKTLDAAPDALWKVIEDFGNCGWMPGGGTGAELEGSGVGMTRIFDGPNGKIRETLESCDAASRMLTYAIPVGVPFPVTGYRATMTVSDDGGKGRLEWACAFEPDGVSEDEARTAIEGMYGVMIGWIGDFLK